MICHNKKILFIHCEKCGGETIEHVIFGKADVGFNKKRPWEGSPQKHWNYKQYLTSIGAEKCSKYFKFSFVRNPWSRVISRISYRNKVLNRNLKISKDIIIKEHFMNTPYINMLFHNNTNCMDFIGKFEKFQSDFNQLCQKIGIPRQELPHKNKTKHKHYTEYYDDETREIVAEKYAKDIEYFGYEFGE